MPATTTRSIRLTLAGAGITAGLFPVTFSDEPTDTTCCLVLATSP